ncbi:phosphate signaling complex protein PhoU [Nocardia sp. NPDC004068]|uniref:phosphate signaling complex protein PhoU n=1 Tax=Nocardia sp. NPDC004068 TaxID=3364303 RepID=UPI0036B05197
MEWSDLLTRIVAWLRAGYPQGVPEQDYLPLLAVLGRRLSAAEIEQVVRELADQGSLPPDRVDAGVAITRFTDELPREADLERVRERLRAGGWPVEEGWQTPVAPDADPVPAPDGVESGMRIQYHVELRRLGELLREMCSRDRALVETATDALVNADVQQAEAAIDLGREVDEMQAEAEREALRLLALQAPVATELRLVVTAIQLTGNLQRMAALATHIATAARRRHPEHVVPESIRPLLSRMGAAAVGIADAAADVLASGDPAAAAGLDELDDTMDQLHRELLSTILDPAWTHGVTAAVDLSLLGRYYERFADNAVEVGRRTIFVATGETADRWAGREPAEKD